MMPCYLMPLLTRHAAITARCRAALCHSEAYTMHAGAAKRVTPGGRVRSMLLRYAQRLIDRLMRFTRAVSLSVSAQR